MKGNDVNSATVGLSVDALNQAHRFMRSVAAVVLTTFTTVVVSPGAQAIAQTIEHVDVAASTAAQIAAEEKNNFGKALGKARQQLRVLADRPDALNRQPTASERASTKEALRTWREELRRLDDETRAEFDDVAALLNAKNLPSEIKRRHADALAKYQSEMTALNQDMDDALAATDDAVVKSKADAAYQRLSNTRLGRAQQPFDPNNLPNRSLKPANRTPKTTAAEFQSVGLYSNGVNGVAQVGVYDISQLASANDPAFLQATTEVTLSTDIQAKAAELHDNPVEIYNWVRNHVQWQPTWGAVQTASHTLSSLCGNAMDIASLTIALLRASGIPARYVHGTIDVPEANFRNWAGGFQNINAATDFASAGGIPLGYVTAGGKITKVRMEHVWVEAAVDFNPSRGAINKSADSWVPMDPSYKQLQILPGLDAIQISGIDPTQLANNFIASGTVNEAEGWATGFDPAILQTAQTQAQTSLQNYIQTNLPTATVGDVLGGRKIIEQAVPVLPASLPNKLVFTGAKYATLPAALEQQITFAFGRDILGDLINPQTFPWPQLNNQQVTLSFKPATQADEDTLRALLPSGTITDISQLPTSIPAYLINVIPELKANGNVIMSGNAMTLGTDLDFVFNPKFVSSGEQPFHYLLPAGSYLAVAVVAGSVSPAQLNATRTRLESTKAILESNNQSQISTLSREQLLGDMFQAGVLGYYAQYTTLGYITGLKQGGHHQLTAGVGSFGYEPNVDTFFGIPRRLTAGGVAMNIPIVNAITQDGTDAAAKRNYSIQLGVLSSTLEHAVPEQMFTSSTNPGEAISAVKALQKASQQGQRIYQITSANQATVLPNIHHDGSTMSEITAALAAGKTVITHTDAVSVPGWSGAGYVILDPDTGAGAWKINGGQNGAFLAILILFMIAFIPLFGGLTYFFGLAIVGELAGGISWAAWFASMYSLWGVGNLSFDITNVMFRCQGGAAAWNAFHIGFVEFIKHSLFGLGGLSEFEETLFGIGDEVLDKYVNVPEPCA